MCVPSPRAGNLVMGYGSSIFVAQFCAEPSSRLLCLLRHGRSHSPPRTSETSIRNVVQLHDPGPLQVSTPPSDRHRFCCSKPGLATNPSLKQSPKPGRGPAALFFRVPVLLVLVAKASKLRAEEWTTVNKTSRRQC